MPNVVLEAMASGLPIVATAIAGSEELVRDGENGRLVPPENAEAMTKAIAELLGDAEKRRTMGAASRRRIEQEYTWTRVAEGYLELARKMSASSKQ
jgi:glycosyltransferase involved in cell wall biosynthesis